MEAFGEVHEAQLKSIGFPNELLPILYAKLKEEVLTQEIGEDPDTFERTVTCIAEGGFEPNSDVFLIDHAYTFSVETYRRELKEHPELLERLAAMMGCRAGADGLAEEVNGDVTEDANGASSRDAGDPAAQLLETLVESSLVWRRPNHNESLYTQVAEAIWQFCSSYKLVDPGDPYNFKTLWFVMDELGSAFSHSREANFRVAPFVYLRHGASLRGATAYSLAWPVARVEHGELCTRDFLSGVNASNQRLARLALWFKLPRSVHRHFGASLEKHIRMAEGACAPDANGTVGGGHAVAEEQENEKTHSALENLAARVRDGGTIHIYCDNSQITEHLCRPEFEHVSAASEADIVWVYHCNLNEQYRRQEGVRKDAVLGQTPGDECIVFKHLLPKTAAAGGASKWLPLTFNMQEDLEALVAAYTRRRQRGEPWLMILKPWNMGRSMDSTVADSLAQVLRYVETGPKVCCEYIAHPALLGGRKFDLRYRVVVRCWRPLEVWRWTHVGCRLSNRPYSLQTEDLGDFERHFTVMDSAGYDMDVPMETDFLAQFEREHGVPFAAVDAKVDDLLREVFAAAARVVAAPSSADPDLHRCASMYGCDVIFTRDLEPRLLEVTFGPDCHRALDEDAFFYDKAFGTVCFGETVDFTKL